MQFEADHEARGKTFKKNRTSKSYSINSYTVSKEEKSSDYKNATYSQMKEQLRRAEVSFVDTTGSREHARDNNFDDMTEYDDDECVDEEREDCFVIGGRRLLRPQRLGSEASIDLNSCADALEPRQFTIGHASADEVNKPDFDSFDETEDMERRIKSIVNVDNTLSGYLIPSSA